MKQPILLHFDEYAFNQRISEESKGILPCQKIYDYLKSIDNFKFPFDQLEMIVREKSAYIKTLLESQMQDTMVFGIRLSKKKLADLVDIDFEKIDKLCKDCEPYLSSIQHFILKGDKLIIDPGKEEKLKEFYSIVAKTASDIRLIELHRNAAEALNLLDKALTEVYGNEEIWINAAGRNNHEFRRFFDKDKNGIKVKDYYYIHEKRGFPKK